MLPLKSHLLFFLSFLLLFNHLLGSPLLIKDYLCSLGPSDGWVRIAAVHHSRKQKQLFCCSPSALMLQMTLSSTLVSPSCFFSFQTLFLFHASPFAQSFNSLLHFFFKFKSFLLQFFRNCHFLLQAYLIKASLQSRCNYFTCIPSVFVSFLTPLPLYITIYLGAGILLN